MTISGTQIIKVKLSDSKYVAIFLVKVNCDQAVSLFDRGTTISCMSKGYFDTLHPKPPLIMQHTCRVNGADGNSLSLLGTTTFTLEFPQKVSATIHSL